MKSFTILSIFVASTAFAANPAWKVVAETSKCTEKIQILAKEGESFVYAVKGGEKTKLIGEANSIYNKDAPKAVTFSSQANARGETISFTNPSVVEANLPKIQFASANKGLEPQKCNLSVK
jgi:hypothetical protein